MSSSVNSNPSTNSSPVNAPLFHIKKFNLAVYWKWIIESDMCAICRAHVMDACLKCGSENKDDYCVIVWGQCNHSFHNCCMERWIQRSNRCPLCQQEWKRSQMHQLN